MDDNWRYSATAITKYDPAYRDYYDVYTKNEWISFYDIGKTFDGVLFTEEEYLETERKYIQATKLFFEFHQCEYFELANLETQTFTGMASSITDDRLIKKLDQSEGNRIFELALLPTVVQSILREFIWGELFCRADKNIAVRFGYDYHMYFNSSKDMDPLLKQISSLGLYVS